MIHYRDNKVDRSQFPVIAPSLDQWRRIISELCDAVDALTDERDAATKDAERYRWLRDSPRWHGGRLYTIITQHQNAIWDQTIDAALSQTEQT